MKTKLIVISMVLLLVSCKAVKPEPMLLTGDLAAPSGFANMPEPDRREADLESLKLVLHLAHSIYTYKTDLEKYGEEEYYAWPEESFANGKLEGDCEDFAFFIYSTLYGMGIQSRVARVYMLNRSRHHIVVVANGYVLDNEYKRVMTKSKLPYEWLVVSSYGLHKWYKPIRPEGVDGY